MTIWNKLAAAVRGSPTQPPEAPHRAPAAATRAPQEGPDGLDSGHVVAPTPTVDSAAHAPRPEAPGRGRAGAVRAAAGASDIEARPAEQEAPRLTREGLEAWVRAPYRIDIMERSERRSLADSILAASVIMPDGRLHIEELELWYVNSSTLPPGLHVNGRLTLNRTGPDFKHLCEHIDIGTLSIHLATALRSLGTSLRVRGDVNIVDAQVLAKLPARYTIGGQFRAVMCPRLSQAPASHRVAGPIILNPPASVDPQTFYPISEREVFPAGEEPIGGTEVYLFAPTLAAYGPHQPPDIVGGIALSLAHLPTQRLDPAARRAVECPFLRDSLGDLPKVVFWRKNNVLMGADFASFRAWWVVHGTCPTTRLPIAHSELFSDDTPG